MIEISVWWIFGIAWAACSVFAYGMFFDDTHERGLTTLYALFGPIGLITALIACRPLGFSYRNPNKAAKQSRLDKLEAKVTAHLGNGYQSRGVVRDTITALETSLRGKDKRTNERIDRILDFLGKEECEIPGIDPQTVLIDTADAYTDDELMSTPEGRTFKSAMTAAKKPTRKPTARKRA